MNDENYFSFDENTCNLASFSNYALQQDIWGLRPVSYMRTTESSKYHNINTQQHFVNALWVWILYFSTWGVYDFFIGLRMNIVIHFTITFLVMLSTTIKGLIRVFFDFFTLHTFLHCHIVSLLKTQIMRHLRCWRLHMNSTISQIRTR